VACGEERYRLTDSHALALALLPCGMIPEWRRGRSANCTLATGVDTLTISRPLGKEIPRGQLRLLGSNRFTLFPAYGVS
jgi:hypothetical protein